MLRALRGGVEWASAVHMSSACVALAVVEDVPVVDDREWRARSKCRAEQTPWAIVVLFSIIESESGGDGWEVRQ